MRREALNVSEEVETALGERRPVVVLESALLSFGLPPPLNLETYLEMEHAVRGQGAVPAGTAILDGKPRLGLAKQDVERLAAQVGCEKASLADLAWIAASGVAGATTVAATLALAHAGGCRVFATGGIGGVHPGVTEDFDISADIAALARYPVAVVSSGAKAILDVPKTLELLEAAGVSVVGLGTGEFPLFYSRESGYRVRQVASIEQAASVAAEQRRLGLPGAVLVGNPVPAGAALERSEVSEWIHRAETESRARGVRGRERTPWVLSRLAELSGGRTVAANRALLVGNAAVAGALAVALCRKELAV
ncbi:MAG: pseudouridine-5'-phosphate glycosidase [Candidatus Wallbacteria bacterium]|nr:pseudouridine-5'-phosphate glycosidase [Candidatus Wallbacteria bacterium]